MTDTTRDHHFTCFQERDCHYFRVLSEPLEANPHQKWLLMCDPPASFFCDTEQYRGPAIGDA